MSYTSLYIFIFIIFFGSCSNHSKPDNNNKAQAEYVAIEFYCFCVYEFYTKNQTFINTCSTPALVHAYKLVRPNALFYSTKDEKIIKRVEKIFFEKIEKIDTLTQATDARIVILLRKNDLSTDTLVFNGEYNFSFNEKYNFRYSFQVLDSIRNILNKKTISCP